MFKDYRFCSGSLALGGGLETWGGGSEGELGSTTLLRWLELTV